MWADDSALLRSAEGKRNDGVKKNDERTEERTLDGENSVVVHSDGRTKRDRKRETTKKRRRKKKKKRTTTEKRNGRRQRRRQEQWPTRVNKRILTSAVVVVVEAFWR